MFPEDEGHWAPGAPGFRLSLQGATSLDTPLVVSHQKEESTFSSFESPMAKAVPEPYGSVVASSPLPQEADEVPKAKAAQVMMASTVVPETFTSAMQPGEIAVDVVLYSPRSPAPLKTVVAASPEPFIGTSLSMEVQLGSNIALSHQAPQSTKRRMSSFIKSLFKGCMYPSSQKWEPVGI